MKVVLFCAGQGTRMRDYSDSLPKPMVPVGGQPILRHLMDYYSQFGHREFLLCLGYKAEVIKEYFLGCKTEGGSKPSRRGFRGTLDVAARRNENWCVNLIDTALWRNIGERLWAVQDEVKNEEMFLANYSDGLTDLDLDEMTARFKASNKVACFLAVRPPLTYHMVDMAEDGRVRAFVPANRSDIWINGGYFIFRPEIFDYMREGEELVLEPFERLIAADQLMAYKHDGFWQSMDTPNDHRLLEDMVAQGRMPWRLPRLECIAEMGLELAR